MKLRAAQKEILTYRGGRLAISAVPGSGKTFTLALLATELLEAGLIDAGQGQEVLIVTYMNAGVEAFRARLRQQFHQRDLPFRGVNVRTLHSLALEIVRTSSGYSALGGADLMVADERQQEGFLATAVNGWIESNSPLWHAFLPEDSGRFTVRWREITQQTARTFIRAAKNERLRADQILDTLLGRANASWQEDASEYALLWMLTGVYVRYQQILRRQGIVDFDDLVWQAAEQMEHRPDLQRAFSARWPFVLEDEAQDSIPLQEDLLEALSGPTGNWVRVGDPNQSITSTFTAAHPSHFLAFLDRPEVTSLPLPNSGRSAPIIFGAANRLVNWTVRSHPVPEVRQQAFRPQMIQPTPPGDSQPNPPNREANLRIRVYPHREDNEIPAIAAAANKFLKQHADQTVAILVPTNEVGHRVADHLDRLSAPYDDLLRGSGRQRQVAAALQALLALLADPLSNRSLVEAYASLNDLSHDAAQASPELAERLRVLLRSVQQPETLLFPLHGREAGDALPAGIGNRSEIAALERLAGFLRHVLALRALPPDDLVLSLSDLLFVGPKGVTRGDSAELTIAYQLSHAVRRWLDTQPEWRLPELADQLAAIASGRQSLPGGTQSGVGFEPVAGRITLTTQHGAKGMEWDCVFLLGIDGFWIPDDLEAGFLGVQAFLGGDPAAEAVAQLRQLMVGDAALYAQRTATESAHIDVIGERLRLLYVGITRARRILQISRSRATRRYGREYQAEPAAALGVLYDYVQEVRHEQASAET